MFDIVETCIFICVYLQHNKTQSYQKVILGYREIGKCNTKAPITDSVWWIEDCIQRQRVKLPFPNPQEFSIHRCMNDEKLTFFMCNKVLKQFVGFLKEKQ